MSRLGVRAAGRRPGAVRGGLHRDHPLHEPLLQHRAELRGRLLRARLPEAASRLEPRLRQGAPAGADQTGRPRPASRSRMRAADAVIIGGGVTGCSLAFHLAGAGLGRVLVLERRFVGAGGTGRSVGIIRQLYPTPETTRMVLRSLDVFRRFRDMVGGESGYVGCGVLIGVSAAMRPKLEETVMRQRSLGVRADVLEPADRTS